MIYSSLEFEHIGYRLLNKEFSIESLGTVIIIATIIITVPEVAMPIIFLSYMLYTPVKILLKKLRSF